MNKLLHSIENKLSFLKTNQSLRTLRPSNNYIDFYSNDYLGFANSLELKSMLNKELELNKNYLLGSTGSRLISGNSDYAEDLEHFLAAFYNAESALVYNSGYDANLGFFSSVPQKNDTIILDDKIHASIIDGSRLSFANRFKFKHNDLNDLEKKLKLSKGNVFIAIESVYSMDGDKSSLKAILDLASKYNAYLVIDEAHGLGTCGLENKGLSFEYASHPNLLARIYTFGKALGTHGACIVAKDVIKQYLINFSRSFIYTTAASFHQFANIKVAHKFLHQNNILFSLLKQNISLFKKQMQDVDSLIDSDSPIQCVIIPGNDALIKVANKLRDNNFNIGVVRSPTVAKNSERLRITIHSFNTEQQICKLTSNIKAII